MQSRENGRNTGRWVPAVRVMVLALGFTLCFSPAWSLDSGPPERTVKLIFIHHSCGENWLADSHGGLGKALSQNRYFVSDTNYGWGPNSIGDRTDILDWPEWFLGPQSGNILQALFRERSNHSPYTRMTSDPGGENEVVMFKSCFPNSNLAGRPSDPPKKGSGLTVGHAKAVYTDLLRFFANRPDKLFIAVTAPPVQDSTMAANARAFNSWLVKDWLRGYKGSNVRVFDFYNVLTGINNHHRVGREGIEHIIGDKRNTLHFPTNGDDHPSPAGNRKATKDFVPLLNSYVNQWLATGPPKPPPGATPAAETLENARASLSAGGAALEPPGLIDGFEGDVSAWTSFLDHEKPTSLDFTQDREVVHNGKASLRITYRVAAESWATCSLVFDRPTDWTSGGGLRLFVRTSRPGTSFAVVAYQGATPDSLSHFEFRLEPEPGDWRCVDIPWERLARPAWEGNDTDRFDPSKAMGMALVFEGGEGTLWVDDISLKKMMD